MIDEMSENRDHARMGMIERMRKKRGSYPAACRGKPRKRRVHRTVGSRLPCGRIPFIFSIFTRRLSKKRRLLAGFLFLCLAAGVSSQNAHHTSAGDGALGELRPLFPAAYTVSFLDAQLSAENSRPCRVPTAEEAAFVSPYARQVSILLNNDIVAFYGHPRSRNMGILGRFSKEELNEKLSALASEYRDAAGGRGIIKAFYIIFGTVWPEGEIGVIQETLLREYIEFALENDILVFIDHQIGKYTPEEALAEMLPWLAYPNVHLALDPEWRTTRPMEEIGTVSADEINHVQELMEDYIIENRIPGERLLVVHQFNWRMISERERVNSGFSRVRLVHCADGFGNPPVKRAAYAYNARAENIPVKGFKLFYNFGIPGAGYDSPLLTPGEVFQLNPRPYIIMYQ